jgi:endo-1,4-beta-D-glucanase Y
MAYDRRTFLLATGCAVACVGCSVASTTPKTMGTGNWLGFKAQFYSADGRIIDTGNGGISHSEGQGYGMLLAALAGDRPAFEAMHRWSEEHLLRADMALYSWRYDPALPVPVSDPNNASDGDILIAWSLLVAGERWQHAAYLERAEAVRQAIRSHLLVERHGLLVLLPGLVGFDVPERTTLNPAYYIWPAFEVFRAADGSEGWGRLMTDGETMMNRARFGALDLPTDWVDLRAGGMFSPAEGRPARFGFDAIRVPLYLALAGREAQTTSFQSFWEAYLQQSRAIPAWVDVQTGDTAPYPLSRGALDIVSRVTGRTILDDGNLPVQDYYSAVLSALANLPQQS